MADTSTTIQGILGRLQSNEEAAYCKAVEELATLVTDKSSRDTMFEICLGLDQSTRQYVEKRLSIDGFRVEVKSRDGPGDWSPTVSYLSVKPPLQTVLSASTAKDFNLHDCYNK